MHVGSPCGCLSYTGRCGSKIAQHRQRMTRIPQPAGAEAPEYGHDVPSLLLIEGDTAGQPRVREVLMAAHGMLQVEHVSSLKEGLARLAKRPARAVLLDLSLPEC